MKQFNMKSDTYTITTTTTTTTTTTVSHTRNVPRCADIGDQVAKHVLHNNVGPINVGPAARYVHSVYVPTEATHVYFRSPTFVVIDQWEIWNLFLKQSAELI